MMKLLVDYPDEEEEFVVVERVIGPAIAVQSVLSSEDLGRMQRLCREIYVDPGLIRYAVKLSAATRRPAAFGLGDLGALLMYGASPRASIAMVESARALAALRGRAYVLPEDILAVAMKTLRHRIGLSDEAIATRVQPDTLVQRVLDTIPVPPRPMA